MLDARRLQLLDAVGTAGSITDAARSLNYTPSAVSQQISALERATGLQLVVRLPRGVRLTEAGRVLAGHGAVIARHVHQAHEEMEAVRTLGAGRLRIAAFPSAGATLVPRLVSIFSRRHPNVQVTFEIQEPRDSVDAVRTGLLDVALIFTYPFATRPVFSRLAVQELLADEIFVAIAGDHALAGRSELDARDLADIPWLVSTDPDCARMLHHIAARGGFEPRTGLESDDYLTVGRLVAAGLGVALVPSLAADAMPETVRLMPLRESLVRNIAIVSAADPSPPVSAMLAIAREALAAETQSRPPVEPIVA
jgi:DNA-binding transcriptional LysR family regulator